MSNQDDLDWIDRIENPIMGKVKTRWPDWSSTQELTSNTRPARKVEKLRGQKVEPLAYYGHHTPFTTKTDGNQWVIKTSNKVIAYRAYALIALFITMIWFGLHLFLLYHGETDRFGMLYLSLICFIPALYWIIQARRHGEDKWVVFDRRTGNVCFWDKEGKRSLTVPFEQVNCYWTPVFRRGLSHNFYFMPMVNLPNERHRWWQVYMGFPSDYSQAQYYWSVITAFMDNSKPLPMVAGLYHHLIWMERNGYTLDDITHGGKSATEEELYEIFEEVEAKIEVETNKADNLLKGAKHFSASALIDFYKHVPGYANEEVLSTISIFILHGISSLRRSSLMRGQGFMELLTMEVYCREMCKLIQFFGPLVNADMAAKGKTKEEEGEEGQFLVDLNALDDIYYEGMDADIETMLASYKRMMFEVEHFNADGIIELYQNTPSFIANILERRIISQVELRVRYMVESGDMMFGFEEWITREVYCEELKKLLQFFGRINNANLDRSRVKNPSRYMDLDALDAIDYEGLDADIEALLSSYNRIVSDAEHFKADSIIELYQNTSNFIAIILEREILSQVRWSVREIVESGRMIFGFEGKITREAYCKELNKLLQFFGQIENAKMEREGYTDPNDYMDLHALDDLDMTPRH
ncbi:hypothetical protein [Marinomonas mediterranea]|jgi:hypothetical protein|uniref:Uncharacterized protein n=1 Tax=Marinomonas mediterranea (strain ATCC 700492 / JCM 21426 / NBRC 103028 / MMB-1) TaxID=717774 RepID=F2K1N8_MARM1|nr:hypothetical protein [Marinomonas mediterranea]ADZ92268.1 hypothetical protein Marme_3049 [Marinomonas mediterranea MMB-1]WCN18322.1 hypothetical protein GV053_15420 [Marinomonas mediterranea MMB-1]